MKTLLIKYLSLLIMLPPVNDPTLSDHYRAERVSLERVAGYADANNWDELFSDYHDQWMGKDVGRIRSIVVAPDGSVFMSHKTRYEIWKFNSNGRFVLSFGSKGSGTGSFVMRPKVEGVLGGKYVYTTDVQGRMLFFDLEGRFVKEMKLDYMPLRTVPMNEMKIALFGHVPWKNGKVKYIISIKDYYNEKEKIIWEEIYDPSQNIIELSNGKKMIARLNFDHPSITRYGLAATGEGNLLVASHAEGRISVFTSDGEKISSFDMNIKALKPSNTDIARIYQDQLDAFEKFQERLPDTMKLTDAEMAQIREKYGEEFSQVKDRIILGDHLPLYSTVIMDSDDNILVFEFTEEKDANRFRAYSYSQNGKLIGVSSFESDEYNLKFTNDAFVFHAGYVYAVGEKKQSDGIPLRLLKFKLACL